MLPPTKCFVLLITVTITIRALLAVPSIHALSPSPFARITTSPSRKPPNTQQKFQPSCKIRASKTITQPIRLPNNTIVTKGNGKVNDNDNGKVNDNALHEYMQLPASQYTCVPMPLNSSLSRIPFSRDKFRLVVPSMALRSPGVPLVEVSPVVFARVLVQDDGVTITSEECIIEGSRLIQDLRMNDFFEFKVHLLLTWSSNGNDDGNDGDDGGPYMRAESKIEVNLDPPGPFAFVPKQILEAVGNRAIQMTLGALQKNFMASLGEDFERWAGDEEYRLERRQLELDFLEEEMEIDGGIGISSSISGNSSSSSTSNGEIGGGGAELHETLLAYLNR